MSVGSDTQTLCWILTDGTVGMRIQCLGLADAAGLTPVIKRIHPSWLLRALPVAGRLPGVPATAGGDPIAEPWPDVVISCGRRTAGAALAVRRLGGGHPFLAHIQDPRIDPRHFDMLIVPEHDPARGPNVVTTLGALNPQAPEKLAEAAKPWLTEVADMPRPLIAVNVGGSNKRYEFSPEAVARFVADLRRLSQTSGGSLLVACSRRTDDATRAALAEGLADVQGVVWTGLGENPYLAFLHLCDALVVTSDSVNMASEALATGKPVHVATVEPETGRLAAFHARLRAEGYTRPFDGTLERWTYEPLRETMRVGALLAERLAARSADR
ncbi:mitochondrial fission ELM1 family protein [Thalassobaculum sp. OXR-137]|uniref:mitochondrial fission ELM1 family protein n=1 Tax=Thalassobaculum sp. OXR-137 TaxID=3100173 RepID=UPI002AC8A60D|nr:mitochondrial fission ELM1 family protein [Thalassobaculum sp. OXR-137]WPZ36538.1 mitochondrial fission ELM1 family protein [Thalassobaculum sp. OXR-137]